MTRKIQKESTLGILLAFRASLIHIKANLDSATGECKALRTELDKMISRRQITIPKTTDFPGYG